MEDEDQAATWEAMYARLKAVLALHGVEDAFGEGDYWVLGDNYGFRSNKVVVFKLSILTHELVAALQRTLQGIDDWEIVVAIDIPGTEGRWPPMGLVVCGQQVVDELQRDYFPKEIEIPRFDRSALN